MRQHFDLGSVLVILITFALFVVALFVKGLTKDLLLEGGVLLVSVKLIMMAYKTSLANQEIERELLEIKQMIADAARQSTGTGGH